MNILDVLHNLGFSPIDSGKEYRMRPIYRESSNNNSLVVYKDNGSWIDFAENSRGNLVDLIQRCKNIDKYQAKKWILDKNIELPLLDEKPRQIKQTKYYSSDLLLKLRKDHSYWVNRGVSEDILKQLQGGIVKEGKMAERYVFPIFDSKSKIIGFTGRDLTNSKLKPKYKHIGKVQNWVYPAFLNIKLLKEKKKVILVESPGDLISLYTAGIENVLCLFGVNISPAIINLLIKIDANEIIISTNNDSVNDKNAGNLASEKIFAKLLNFFDSTNIKILLPKNHKDWNEVLTQENADSIRSAFSN